MSKGKDSRNTCKATEIEPFSLHVQGFPQVLPSCSNKSGGGDARNTWEALKHDTTQLQPPCPHLLQSTKLPVHQCAHGMSLAGLASAYTGLAVGFLAPPRTVVQTPTQAHHRGAELEVCQQAKHHTDVWEWIYKHLHMEQQAWPLNDIIQPQRCGSCQSFPLETADGQELALWSWDSRNSFPHLLYVHLPFSKGYQKNQQHHKSPKQLHSYSHNLQHQAACCNLARRSLRTMTHIMYFIAR